MARGRGRDTTQSGTRRSLHSTDPLAFVLRPYQIYSPSPTTTQIHQRPAITPAGSDVTPNPNVNRRSKDRFKDPTVKAQAIAQLRQAVDVCSRREARKQVLHAQGVAGARVSKPRYNSNSKVKCK